MRGALVAGPAVALAVGAGCLPGAPPAAAAARPATAAVTQAGTARANVIVALDAGANAAAAEQAVQRAGGTVTRQLPIINGFAAQVTPAAVAALQSVAGVRSVTPDGSGHLMAVDPALGYDQAADEGSPTFVQNSTNAVVAWRAGYTGKGVDVALIDSGVAPVPGLTSGNVVNGPDLSFESQYADVRYKDTFGHGTHMASIIAGRDVAGTPASYATSTKFNGMAPDARIVNIKVAAADGSADVSQVIAAVNWVTQHAHDNGLNIRVLNLSYGTDSTQAYTLDPLSYAVEQAWRKGIVVVVAAGNDGTTRTDLANPAQDPYVLAVGADDPQNSPQASDDVVPAFAQRGSTTRHVDVVAPGVHVIGLRVPNSYVDQNNPAGRVGTRFIRGSGTSQATAVISGAAALLLQEFPAASPDQIKWLITSSAKFFGQAKQIWQGTGLIDVKAAMGLKPSDAPYQSFGGATGGGTLEGARGGGHVLINNVALTGEKDIFGKAWNASAWKTAVGANTAWTGGTFNGSVWTGTAFNTAGTGWTAATWTSADWTGGQWSSRSWVSRSWVSNSWDSRSWVASSWVSRSWVSDGWADSSWS